MKTKALAPIALALGLALPVRAAAPTLHLVANHYFEIDLKAMISPRVDFALVSGPQWLSLTDDGKLVGKPTSEDVGEHAAVVRVAAQAVSKEIPLRLVVREDDGGLSAVVSAVANRPLRKDLKRLFGVKGRFRMDRCPEWAEVSPDGILTAHPTQAHIGPHPCQGTVADGDQVIPLTLGIVVRGEQPPVPSVAVQATAGSQFVVDLRKALGLDGVYTLLAGPEWISVTEEGTLVGKPGKDAVGRHRAAVKVVRENHATVARVLIEVKAAH